MMRLGFLLLSLCLIGFSCDNKKSPGAAAEEEALPQGLSAKEADFYKKLSRYHKRNFVSLTQNERDEALALAVKLPPDKALEAAADYDIRTLSPEEQQLYSRLNDESKRLFFVLNQESSDLAVLWSKKMDPDLAIRQALQMDLDELSSQERAFYQQLSSTNQVLYLALSDRTQQDLALQTSEEPNKAVQAAEKRDVTRLADDQQKFYAALNDQDRVLYLSLTPDARGMAVALSEGIDPNFAVDYVLALQP